jgi:hypothetical protein
MSANIPLKGRVLMPIREYKGPLLDNPSAVHLHQTDISNCCDRVRIALSEKRVPWEDHFYSLPRGDHLTDAFFELNPKGVVPVLVHNGLVVTDVASISGRDVSGTSLASFRPQIEGANA